MLNQVGLNHIFDDGTICFCLVCKDSIAKNYPMDREYAICQHFRSDHHERSTRNLFKMCVPDPKCESRNIRYLDIVNNSEFEVWDQVGEPCYISKKDNHLVCLICNEEVSKVSRETDQIKNNLQYHLVSELHLSNVKNGIWWTYHPSADTNYIALNNIFMYCSFCQKILESKDNSLLEFAADHIETELKKTNSDNASRIKHKNTDLCSFSKTEIDETYYLSDDSETHLDKTISDNALETELEETNSNDASNTQFGPLTKPRTSIENIQTFTVPSPVLSKTSKSNLVNQGIVKAAGNDININHVTDVLKSAGENVDYECVNSNQICNIFNVDILKEEYVVCPICHEKVEVFNGDVPFSMLKHSQKHKELPLINNDMEFGIQEKANICHRCHKQIEIFNKDTVLSYNHHLESCHPDEGISLVSIENASTGYDRGQEHCEESDIISKAFLSLPNGLKDHLNFVALVGKNLSCILCNCKLSPSDDITTICDVLQNHFSEFYHKTQYAERVQHSIDHGAEDDEELEENNQFFTGLQFSRSTINQTAVPVSLVTNITLEQYNANNNQTMEVPAGKVRTRPKVQEILNRLVNIHPLVNENKHILDEREGHFYCQPCNKILKCTVKGRRLIEHLNGDTHISKLENGVKKKVWTRAKVLNVLKELSSYNKLITQNVEDIGEKWGHFFCKRCDELIVCTLRGKNLIDHLNGPNHGLQLKRLAEEERELRSTARPARQVYYILGQLASKKGEVSESFEVLGEKKGHFYCEICDEVLECTRSGSKLVEHLRNQKHVFKLKPHIK